MIHESGTWEARVTGQTILHYNIVEKLGEGGMGVVWKARDMHLGRFVALKVLPREKLSDPERKRRFVQEAQSASALNHANIVTIYAIADADGVPFIAMEYVSGKTLGQLIGRKGLPLSQALKYAIQIADALGKAHAAGIIHRDLKPSNIMVTEEGVVKVLDFGLAKLMEPAGSELAQTKTLTSEESSGTEPGTILGTVAYMSPEQAEGKKVDARSDIFAFGSVLYEMTTGRRAFHGDSKLSTLSAILKEDPQPVRELVGGAPRDLEKIITRCLRKEADRRFQHMDDLKIALTELKEESDSGLKGQATDISRGRVERGNRRLLWLLAGLLLAAGVGVVWWRLQGPAGNMPLALTQLTTDAGLTYQPALSPDGKLLAYASDRGGEGNLDIWVQQVPRGEPIRVTHDGVDDSEPSFSPDGRTIVFRSDRAGGGIYVVPALGGEARKIADQGRQPRYSPDGRWIAYWVGARRDRAGPIYVMPSVGGQPRQLTPEEGTAARSPIWTPDGKHLLCAGWGFSPWLGTDWYVLPLDGGPPVKTGVRSVIEGYRLSADRVIPLFSPDAWLDEGNFVVFPAKTGDSTELWKISISPTTWQVASKPQRLTVGSGRYSYASASAGGRLVFSSLTRNPDIWSVPIGVHRGKVTGEMQQLTHDAADDLSPSVSADGKRMVFESNRTGTGDLAHEIDAREIPPDWRTGYVPLRKPVPYERPCQPSDRGECYHLNSALVDWAFDLTQNVPLEDTEAMLKERSQFDIPNARRPPFVRKGDELSASTYWHGRLLNQWANDWVHYHTDGKANYVTTAMEDTGTLQSLTFLARAGRVDLNRVLILRTASNYDQQETRHDRGEKLGANQDSASSSIPARAGGSLARRQHCGGEPGGELGIIS